MTIEGFEAFINFLREVTVCEEDQEVRAAEEEEVYTKDEEEGSESTE